MLWITLYSISIRHLTIVRIITLSKIRIFWIMLCSVSCRKSHTNLFYSGIWKPSGDEDDLYFDRSSAVTLWRWQCADNGIFNYSTVLCWNTMFVFHFQFYWFSLYNNDKFDFQSVNQFLMDDVAKRRWIYFSGMTRPVDSCMRYVLQVQSYTVYCKSSYKNFWKYIQDYVKCCTWSFCWPASFLCS